MKKNLNSLIIPAYNSSSTIKDVVSRAVEIFDKKKLDYEIIIVNDGSTDNTWKIIKKLAQQNKKITSINLLKNYGQHSATICGIGASKGHRVITIDDDLQHHPEDIIKLIEKCKDGHDSVFAGYKEKQHSLYRQIGSKIITQLNTHIFNKPAGLYISSFRCFTREVANRILEYKTSYPYINGLVLLFSSSPTNVLVKHHSRHDGESNYSMKKILKLTFTILFNYSSFPLRLTSVLGLVVALMSFLIGMYFLLKALFVGTSVVGWASVVVLLSFLNGTILVIIGMLGEYVIRILNQQSSSKSYDIKEVVNE